MATRVSITKALEAKLRKGEGIEEVVKLLDDEQGKRAAAQSAKEGDKPGLGYKELVALLRSYLGDALLTPPQPSPSYIIKIVNKVKEQGLDYSNVEQVISGLLRTGGERPGSGTYRLADIVYNLDRYYAAGSSFTGEPRIQSGGTLEEIHGKEIQRQSVDNRVSKREGAKLVFTGRDLHDETDDE